MSKDLTAANSPEHQAEVQLLALTRLSCELSGAPLAWFSSVDGGRWKVVCQSGFDADRVDQVIASDQLFVLEDVMTDEYFQRHPWVVGEPHLRCWANVPLADESGKVFGAITVADTKPREFSQAQLSKLEDLAALGLAAWRGHQALRDLDHMIKTDPLTGLGNRAHFLSALEVELSHSMRTGEPFTVLCLDLDGFKEVGDGFGHAAAEEVLCEVAQRLARQLRLGDVLARLGDDEFGVVMRHGALESAEVLAKRIVGAVSQPITLLSQDVVGVGISVGIAAYTDQVESVEALLSQAGEALFQAKKQNERRWKMFVGVR